jgi:hypothetical protein
LFRISDFEIRIWLRLRRVKGTVRRLCALTQEVNHDQASEKTGGVGGAPPRVLGQDRLERMAAAAALGGLLASPSVAQAKKDGGKEKTKLWCCQYSNGQYYQQICSPDPCPPSYWMLPLVASRRVGSCKKCPPVGW